MRYVLIIPVLLILLTVVACKRKKKAFVEYVPPPPVVIGADSPTVVQSAEYKIYQAKQELSKSIGIGAMENSTDSFELRVWEDIVLPRQLKHMYIIKGNGESWTMLHYKYDFSYDTTTKLYSKVVIRDTIPKIKWEAYIKNLDIGSLYTAVPQSQTKHHLTPEGSVSYTIEIVEKSKYKIIHYDDPCFNKEEENHRIICNFLQRFFASLPRT